tara:strand:- start:610 stop:1401 length:792 start_codon:yes stop_codon:yes gene_type:complete
MADKVNRYAANWRSLEDQTKRREANLKLEDQKLIKRYAGDIEDAKAGKYKTTATQTSLTGLTQNWGYVPQKEGLNEIETVLRNLNYVARHSPNDQISGAVSAATWDVWNKFVANEEQDSTTVEAANRSIDQENQDMTVFSPTRDGKTPSEFFGTNQYGEGGSKDPTNVAKTTSVKEEQNKTKESKGYDNSFVEDDLDLADRQIEGRTVIPDNPNRQGYVGGKKISNIQKDLLRAGHTKEDLSALMEANKNRPKVTDLLKIFKK